MKQLFGPFAMPLSLVTVLTLVSCSASGGETGEEATTQAIDTILAGIEANYGQRITVRGLFETVQLKSWVKENGTRTIKTDDGYLEITEEKEKVHRAAFTLFLDKIRADYLGPDGEVVESLARVGDIITHHSPRSKMIWKRSASQTANASLFDPRQVGLPDTKWLTWRDFIRQNRVTAAGFVTVTGVKMGTIALQRNHGSLEAKFDIHRNCLPVDVVNYRADRSVLSHTVISYEEICPSVWFPKKSTYRSFEPGTKQTHAAWLEQEEHETKDFAVSLEPADDASFEIKVPEDTQVHDVISTTVLPPKIRPPPPTKEGYRWHLLVSAGILSVILTALLLLRFLLARRKR